MISNNLKAGKTDDKTSVKILSPKLLKIVGITLAIAIFVGGGIVTYKTVSFNHRAKKYAIEHNIEYKSSDISSTVAKARDCEKSGNSAMALTLYKQAEQFGYPDFEKSKKRIIEKNKVNLKK